MRSSVFYVSFFLLTFSGALSAWATTYSKDYKSIERAFIESDVVMVGEFTGTDTFKPYEIFKAPEGFAVGKVVSFRPFEFRPVTRERYIVYGNIVPYNDGTFFTIGGHSRTKISPRAWVERIRQRSTESYLNATASDAALPIAFVGKVKEIRTWKIEGSSDQAIRSEVLFEITEYLRGDEIRQARTVLVATSCGEAYRIEEASTGGRPPQNGVGGEYLVLATRLQHPPAGFKVYKADFMDICDAGNSIEMNEEETLRTITKTERPKRETNDAD